VAALYSWSSRKLFEIEPNFNVAGPGVIYTLLDPPSMGLPVTDVLAVWTAKTPLRLSSPDCC